MLPLSNDPLQPWRCLQCGAQGEEPYSVGEPYGQLLERIGYAHGIASAQCHGRFGREQIRLKPRGERPASVGAGGS